MRVTLEVIAEKIGITKATVSKALRNSPELNKETIRRVQTIALELGYTPAPYKKRWDGCVVDNPLNTVNLVFYRQTPAFIHSNPFFSQVVECLRLSARSRTCTLLESYPADPDEFRKILSAANTDATILLSNIQAIEPEMAYRIIEIGSEKPVVLLANYIPILSDKLACIRADNFSAGYLMALHLKNLGADKIHFIEAFPGLAVSMDRHFGYLKAMYILGQKPSILHYPATDEATLQQDAQLKELLREPGKHGLVGDGDIEALRIGRFIRENCRGDEHRFFIGGIDGVPEFGPDDMRAATFKIDIHGMAARALEMSANMRVHLSAKPEQWLIGGSICNNPARQL